MTYVIIWYGYFLNIWLFSSNFQANLYAYQGTTKTHLNLDFKICQETRSEALYKKPNMTVHGRWGEMTFKYLSIFNWFKLPQNITPSLKLFFH